MKLKTLLHRIALQRKEEYPFPDNLEEYLEDFVPNILLKSETLQIAFGVSNYEMEKIYEEGYAYYEAEDYSESATSFRWLVLLDSYTQKYWMSLAASQQMLKQYEKALHSYAAAALLDSDDPHPHYYAFECYKLLDNHEDAKKALDLAHKRTEGKEEHKPLQDKILLHDTELLPV